MPKVTFSIKYNAYQFLLAHVANTLETLSVDLVHHASNGIFDKLPSLTKSMHDIARLSRTVQRQIAKFSMFNNGISGAIYDSVSEALDFNTDVNDAMRNEFVYGNELEYMPPTLLIDVLVCLSDTLNTMYEDRESEG